MAGKHSTPGMVLLFRHAEKPTVEGAHDLSVSGRSRAERIAEWLPERFGKPDFIIAAARGKVSNRPYDTVVPLSRACGVAIETPYKDGKYKKLAHRLLGKKRYAGKLVVVCWHHENIPHLARKLRATKKECPKDWDDSVYDLVYALSWDGGKRPRLELVTEPF